MRISVKAKRNLLLFEETFECKFQVIDQWCTTDGEEPWIEIDENWEGEEWYQGAEVLYKISHNFKLRKDSKFEFGEREENVQLYNSFIYVTVGRKNDTEMEEPDDVLERLHQFFMRTEIIVRYEELWTWTEIEEFEHEGY